MKLKKFAFAGLPVVILIGMQVLLFSCNKKTSDEPAHDLFDFANRLNGEIISGTLNDSQTPEGLWISCESKNIFFLEKSSTGVIVETGHIANAEIMHSKFGIIIRDKDRNMAWVYVNNDPESQEKFYKVIQGFSYVGRSEIAGHTRIKI
jgi:hypothetical protein